MRVLQQVVTTKKGSICHVPCSYKQSGRARHLRFAAKWRNRSSDWTNESNRRFVIVKGTERTDSWKIIVLPMPNAVLWRTHRETPTNRRGRAPVWWFWHPSSSPVIGPDLGHGGPGAVPVSGRGVLPRGGLLRAGVRRHRPQHLQDSGQLEGRVPDPGQPKRPWELPLCGSRQ